MSSHRKPIDRPIKLEPRSRSRSPPTRKRENTIDRPTSHRDRDSHRDNKDRRDRDQKDKRREDSRSYNNDRDRGPTSNSDFRPREIKREKDLDNSSNPQSDSRGHQQDRRRDREGERDRDGPRSSDNRDRGRGPTSNSDFRPPREPKREKDWENFFNPESDMSKQAVARREREKAEREDRIAEYDPNRNKEGGEDDDEAKKNLEKEKPNFGLSGKLTEETNTYRGVVIKYSEPVEARKPLKTRWRLYPFKDGEGLDVMYIHRQSAYLLGRERNVADIPIDHPSCSKQHAVIQYRLVPYIRPDGSKGRRIRPYVIDLESSNGTYVNGERIQPKRYVELMEKDVLKFGFSSREYVLLHEHSKDDDPDLDDGLERSPTPD